MISAFVSTFCKASVQHVEKISGPRFSQTISALQNYCNISFRRNDAVKVDACNIFGFVITDNVRCSTTTKKLTYSCFGSGSAKCNEKVSNMFFEYVVYVQVTESYPVRTASTINSFLQNQKYILSFLAT